MAFDDLFFVAYREGEQMSNEKKLSSARWDEPAYSSEPFPHQMVNSDATGLPLVKHGKFGADMIRFKPGKKVGPHTHPGDHVLICIRGVGVLWYDGLQKQIDPGFIYMVPGSVPHAVYADPDSPEDLVLFAIGNDHQPVDSASRLDVTEHDVKPKWKGDAAWGVIYKSP